MLIVAARSRTPHAHMSKIRLVKLQLASPDLPEGILHQLTGQ